MKLLVLAGEKYEKLMGRKVVNVPVRDVEVDELWGFVQKKEGHKTKDEVNDESIGDAYCFVAMERHTKLVLNLPLDAGIKPQRTCSSKGFGMPSLQPETFRSLLMASRPTERP